MNDNDKMIKMFLEIAHLKSDEFELFCYVLLHQTEKE